MAEMWTRSPIMQGNTEQHQLALISQLCGSITPEVRARAQASCGRQEERCGGVGRVWDRALPGLFPALCTGCCVLLALECAHCWRGGWGSS